MESTANEVLRARGLRVTSQRTIVLQALMGEPNDVTAAGLFERLRPVHPALGLTTIYRTLNTLAEAGAVDALHHGHATCYRYCEPGHHHHLTCRRCHRVVEIRDCGLQTWADEHAASHGFRQPEHSVELTGLCPSC